MFQLRVELMWNYMSCLQFSVKNHREYPLNFSQNDENFRFSNIHVFLYNHSVSLEIPPLQNDFRVFEGRGIFRHFVSWVLKGGGI